MDRALASGASCTGSTPVRGTFKEKTMVKKLIVLLGIMLFFFNLGMAQPRMQDENLYNTIVNLSASLEQNDISIIKSMLMPDVRINGQAVDRENLEKMFSIMKEVQKTYDYRKIYKINLNKQKKFMEKDEFYLGGHEFGYLTVKLKKEAGNWAIVSIDQCR
jgi:hypothetical protein